MSNVAANLKRLRDNKGLSQDELAEISKTTKKTIARIETGKTQSSKISSKL